MKNPLTNTRHPLRILLLCDYDPSNASTVVDSIDAFRQFSQHTYVVRSGRGDLLAGIDLSDVDGIFIHYSLVACYDSYLAPASRRKIRTFQGYKALYIQDEYRFINQTIAALDYMQIHALFSVVGPEAIDRLYPPEKLPGVYKTTLLTGYVPDNLIGIATPPYTERSIDVSYRARKLPAYLGSHTLQKWQIADQFNADAPDYGLKVDISWREEDRMYGEAWVKFVANSKATLGTESGASVCDFTGEIQKNVEAHLARHPDATFEELRERYFKNEDGKIVINCISPRCFESAALKTLMIMYEGEYSGILTPWEHYVPLKKDHSNMEEVVAVLRDPPRAARIIETAYQEVIASGNYSYRAMMAQIDGVMEELITAGLKPSPHKRVLQQVSAADTVWIQLLGHGVRLLKSLKQRLRRALVYQSRGRLEHYPAIKQCVKDLLSLLRTTRLFTQRQFKKIPMVTYLVERHRVLTLKRFFLYHADTEIHLYLTTAKGTLNIVALPVRSQPIANAKSALSTAELEEHIRSGSIRQLRWINLDKLGLGSNKPFETFYIFHQIQKYPRMLRRLFAAVDDTIPWVTGFFSTSQPIMLHDGN